MLPTMRQRLLITASVVVGGLVWMWAEPALLPADRAGGVTLLNASAGPLFGLLTAIACGLVAMTLAVVVGAVGHPLATAFVFSASLMFVAADGGSSLAFLWRASPSSYLPLLVECVVWFALLFGTLGVTLRTRAAIRSRIPTLVNTAVLPRSPFAGFADTQSLVAIAVCTGVAGVVSSMMLGSWDIGQILGALVFAFLVGALIAQTVSPTASAGPILLSPLVLAAYGYVQTWMGYASNESQFLPDAYRGDLLGFAWTLPIHFASAGVVGCVLGIGMAKGLVGFGKAATHAHDSPST